MTGRVTMRNISRWTLQGGSYPHDTTLFQHGAALDNTLLGVFRTHLLERKSVYIIAGDEVVRSKSGSHTYGLSRFFPH